MVVSRRTYIRRRVTVFGSLGLVLATAFYLPMSLLAPLEQITPSLISVAAPDNPAVELAWPGNGSAAIGAVGFPGVLAQSSDTSVRPIASITKVITSLVVLQEKPLAPDESGPVITMTQRDVDGYHRQISRNGSAEPVAAGIDFTQRQLLDIVLIASANNYAETMARWAFGTEDAFLVAARTWLDAHGLTGIVLYDATGLDPRNASNPADLIELGKIALAHPVISAIVSSATAIVPYVGMIENTNTLLGWNGVDGIKTGTVELDDVCLLFATTLTVGTRTIDLIGVVLGSPSHTELDSAVRQLLTTAMQGFRDVPLVTAGEKFGTYSSDWEDDSTAVAATSASIVVWAGVPVTVSVQMEPISTGAVGQTVGTVTYTADSATTTVPLTLNDSLEDPGPWWRLTHPFG
jgi:D-alanyl-D-alanine carboxypeptidase (penicillin-binding protein 5/6)